MLLKPIGLMRAVVAGGSGSWTEEITDNFNRTNEAPVTGWTEINGSYEIANNAIRPDSAVSNRVMVYSTAVSTATQFVKVKYASIASLSYDGVVLRHATGNHRYVVRYDQTNSQLHLRYTSDTNAYTTFHTITSFTLTTGDSLAVAVSGTDANTEFTIWKNPTGGTVPSDWGTATYTINSANWSGAPASYHNTGTNVGVYHGGINLYCLMDDFSGGSYE